MKIAESGHMRMESVGRRRWAQGRAKFSTWVCWAADTDSRWDDASRARTWSRWGLSDSFFQATTSSRLPKVKWAPIYLRLVAVAGRSTSGRAFLHCSLLLSRPGFAPSPEIDLFFFSFSVKVQSSCQRANGKACIKWSIPIIGHELQIWADSHIRPRIRQE